MAGKPGMLSTLPTALPASYTRGFPWNLDRRTKAVREVAADLVTLWQDLGGVDNLSAQELALVERAVFLRRRVVAYESAVLADEEPPMTHGEYSNHVNVLLGLLRTLGLERRSRPIRTLHEHMAAREAS